MDIWTRNITNLNRHAYTVTKTHEEVFKETFRQKEIAEAFFFVIFYQKSVVEDLDWDRLQLENASFTDESLAERFSDVVYRCPFKSQDAETILSLLLEHKTGVVKFPHLQLLKYITNIWDTQIKQKQKPGPVLPVLFVQGPKGVTYKPLEHYIQGATDGLLPYLPRSGICLGGFNQSTGWGHYAGADEFAEGESVDDEAYLERAAHSPKRKRNFHPAC
ncbi:MAG: Rpn family recombination-promoting nuclease/putative transposase [Lewinellaceae bacterium]|nr:Rpn family recombination-promoting nuclease/putative transposase [Lewinellaceae bacterium]